MKATFDAELISRYNVSGARYTSYPSANVLAGWLLAVWLVATVAGRVIAYTLPIKIQTAAAVLVVFSTVFLIGYFIRTGLGWYKSTRQGL